MLAYGAAEACKLCQGGLQLRDSLLRFGNFLIQHLLYVRQGGAALMAEIPLNGAQLQAKRLQHLDPYQHVQIGIAVFPPPARGTHGMKQPQAFVVTHAVGRKPE